VEPAKLRRPFRRYWKGGPNAAKDPKVKDQIRKAFSRTLRGKVEAGQSVGRPRRGEDYNDHSIVNTEGQQVLALRSNGASIRSIARTVGWSKNTVYDFLARHRSLIQ